MRVTLAPDLLDQSVADLADQLEDGDPCLGGERRMLARRPSSDEPAGVGVIVAYDAREEVEGWFVTRRQHTLGEAEISDRALETPRRGGDVALILPSDQDADTARDFMRYVVIRQLERHVMPREYGRKVSVSFGSPEDRHA